MASSFNIAYPGTSGEFVSAAEKAITNQGGAFDGNDTKGTFSIDTPIGDVKGGYLVLSEPDSPEIKIEVTITDKPFLVSTRKIESTIKEFLMK